MISSFKYFTIRIGQHLMKGKKREILRGILFVIGILYIVYAGSVYQNTRLCMLFFLIGLGIFLRWGYLKGHFSNKLEWSDAEKGKEHCERILSSCKQKLCFLGGEGNSEFLEDPQIKQIIEGLAKKGREIKFLFGPHYDVRSITFLKWAKNQENVEMRRVNTRIEGEHFKVVDEEYVQVSYKHAPFQEEREGYIIYSPGESKRKLRNFKKIWEEAEIFDVEKGIKKAEEKHDEFIENKDVVDQKEGVRIIKKWENCEWGISAGFIKKEKKEGSPTAASLILPATKEEIEKLRKEVLGE